MLEKDIAVAIGKEDQPDLVDVVALKRNPDRCLHASIGHVRRCYAPTDPLLHHDTRRE